MSKPFQNIRQPSQGEVQSLLNIFNAGRLQEAEAAAKALLRSYPSTFILHNVLGVALEGQRKFEEAAAAYRKALEIEPKIAEIHFNLGVVLGNLGRIEETVASYRKAIALKPDLTVAYFNLGAVLQEQGRLDEAVACYRKAVALEPGFFEAYGNLGTVLQKQGKLEDAVVNYRKALAINPDARGHFNLGTALRDQGKHEEAGQSYLRALSLKPDYADAHNNLGEIFRDQGNMDDAIKSYQTAMAIDPAHAGANYNMGEFLHLAGKYEEAIPYFERSGCGDCEARVLDCLYRIEKYDEFKSRLRQQVDTNRKSVLLAALSTHYATNFGVEDEYNYCKNPMDFVYHGNIEQLADPDSQLLKDLLNDITHTDLAARKQGRLYNGMQSAGNLLKRPEASFQKLAALIRQKIDEYRQHYAGEDCELIRSLPRETEFSSSWFLRMKQGGHLTSHIHEEGWISGCVYLVLPRNKKDVTDGAFEYSTQGDRYPRQHDNFPSVVVVQQVGDIVLFPSSLFHRTIPFNSDEERVCVAFDLKPMVDINKLKLLLIGLLQYLCIDVSEYALMPTYFI
jgi:uncharacterized protein (TIGR02466 family)